MRQLPSVILRHQTHGDTHHDWLFESPLPADGGALIAARVVPPPSTWCALGRLALTPLPLHRRHYLTYQGPIDRDRGQVQRLDTGWLEVVTWAPAHQRFRFQMGRVTGLWEVIYAGDWPAWLNRLAD